MWAKVDGIFRWSVVSVVLQVFRTVVEARRDRTVDERLGGFPEHVLCDEVFTTAQLGSAGEMDL